MLPGRRQAAKASHEITFRALQLDDFGTALFGEVKHALNFIGRDTLYGRYWGCVADYPCLHFELCYYQAMDWAIEHRMERIEACAQGEHKLARGYLPTPVHSLHWIADPGLRAAIADFLERERAGVASDQLYLGSRTPFRKGERTDR